MFNKKEDIHYSKATTIIGADCQFQGDLKASGTIRVDGEFKGEIRVDGNIYIGETAKIEGNIYANNVMVSGEIKGNIEAHQQLRITSSGSLWGDVNVTSFILDENSSFDGNCKMKHDHVKTETTKDPV